MANLIDDLGSSYINESISGALLFAKGFPHQIQRIRSNGIETIRYSGSMAKPITTSEVMLPSKILDKGFEALAHPTLGYRTAADGKILFELRQRQSFRRGLQLAEIVVKFPPVTQYIAERCGIDLKYYQRPDVKALACVEDCFLTLQEGLKRVASKETFTFALSPVLACMPSSKPSNYLDLVFDGRVVGNVAEDGTVTGRITKVNKIMEKLNGK